MRSRTALFVGTSLLLVGILWPACSENSSTSLGSSPPLASGIGQYFPLYEGYSTTYSVQYADGNHETVRFKVGRQAPFGGVTAQEWFAYTPTGAVNTSYFITTAKAIDHYAVLAESAQRILELPLELGHTWTVNVSTTDGYYDTHDSLATDTNDDKLPYDTSVYDDGGPLFSYPALGSTYLTVEGFENLKLNNDDYYSSALKISSTDRSGMSSYYWYVSGVGLVRYVIEATGSAFPEGRVVGELEHYSYN